MYTVLFGNFARLDFGIFIQTLPLYLQRQDRNMEELESILQNNKQWVERTKADKPDFFANLAKGQQPRYLWIGCSDSRVPSTTITGLEPGDMFVHRNIANVVNNNDLNILSVMEYAVRVLKVRSILVCGHYGCGGVKAAMENLPHGMVDNWLRPIKQVYLENQEEIDQIKNEDERVNRLSELNVKRQVEQVANSTIVQDAWADGQQLSVHGLVYSLENGILKDLQVSKVDRNGTPGIFHVSG